MKPRKQLRTLRAWREEKQLTQAEAAAKLGLSMSSYKLFEYRRRFVKGELAQHLMEETGVPIEVLAGVA